MFEEVGFEEAMSDESSLNGRGEEPGAMTRAGTRRLMRAPPLDMPKLVIFDCDGVLVDSEPISNRVLAEMLSEQGLETTVGQARRDYQGLLLAEVRTAAERKLDHPLPQDWLERYEAARNAAFRRELQRIDGAADTVRCLIAAGVQVCVASQGKPAKIDLSLQLTGLSDLFPPAARFSSYAVANGKPAPDIFLHAAASMDAAASECLVIEDTPSGVRAAVSARMLALGYAADSDASALRAAGATHIIYSLAQLRELLGLG